MKIKYFILSAILSVGILTSCTLDYNEVTLNDEEWVYENFQQVDRLLIDIYARIRHDFGYNINNSGNLADSLASTSGTLFHGAMLASASDEADFSNSLSHIHRYYNGAWSSINAFSNTWTNSYAAIFQANDFLEKMDKVWELLEVYKHTVQGVNSYENLKARFTLYPHEARFLRAFFHFELAKTYGDVPLVTRTLTTAEANAIARTPVQEVFKFIVDECDAIVDFLPITYATEASEQIGRIHRPAVLALKARALLYAASPLHNPANPKEAWKQAALANKDLIDRCQGWNIELSSYGRLWHSSNHFDVSEVFFVRRVGNINFLERVNYPVGNENARGGNCPTQNLVDAYEYQTGDNAGKTWPQAEEAGTLSANPYENLDPRFALTIARNGDRWPTVSPYNTPLEIFQDGRNGAPLLNATTTGYYLKKYVDGSRNITAANSNTSFRSWIIYRLSEFYLNYAEAMFNYMDRNSTATDGAAGLTMSANDAINVLRSRPGINMPLFTSTTNGDAWEERYIRERMVELAFEGHRFWDVRRWKKGSQFFINIKTIEVNRDGNVSRGRNIVRLWNERNNLFPIPFEELRKAPNLVQNTGWEI
jgi:hypothetical protein